MGSNFGLYSTSTSSSGVTFGRSFDIIDRFPWPSPSVSSGSYTSEDDLVDRHDHDKMKVGSLQSRPDNSYGQGGPDDDLTSEFEVGQQFDNKEAILIVIKKYSIRRAVEYKILESDQLKYFVHCT
ncbi:hypothetical protein PIB30_096748 [Stylosanthes scabra]|uniref:Uncharacterized protein n=1 Tax=Stylosanthes scabra TaxID=79078 RepID=A0ABU6UVM0_9FABA|nr:hypothetical protein [Stylosanthes scabra]